MDTVQAVATCIGALAAVFAAIAAWRAAIWAKNIGERQNKINESNSELDREPHISLEIQEMTRGFLGFLKLNIFPNNRIWKVLVKNAGRSRPIRLKAYYFSDEGKQPLGDGALIAPGDFYPIPLLGKNTKEGGRKFLVIEFEGDSKHYHAQYAIMYNRDIDSWYWYKTTPPPKPS